MATTTGNDGVITVDGTAIVELRGWEVEENADRLEDTVLGDANRTYKAGLKDVRGTIDCRYDKADAGQTPLVVGDEPALVLRPEGTGAGLAEWTITASITGIRSSVVFQEVNDTSYTWEAAGALTKTTQP